MKTTDVNVNKSMTVGATKVVVQDINLENTKAVISILRDKIYTDKPKAALMETVCNAIDEHKKYNIKRPVDIIITETNVIVRDYAKGLDEHGVMRVFFQYMNSTKSDNDFDIGGYGIGAKAPSSYTNTWYVTSYHGGKKTTYMSVLDGDVGKTYKMLEQACDIDNTGICVSIPIVNKNSGFSSYGYSSSDISKFLRIAGDLRSMLGGTLPEDNVNCYYFDKHSPVKDYNDFLECTQDAKNNAKDAFNNTYSKQPLRELLKAAKKEDFSKFISAYIPGEILIYRHRSDHYGNRSNRLFASDFFESKTIMAYDGDVCYNVNLDSSITREFDLNYGGVCVLFFFKRGELPIAPTREDINMSDKANELFKKKLIKLQKHVVSRICNKFEDSYKANNTIYYAVHESRSFNALSMNLDFSKLVKHKFINNFNRSYNYVTPKNTGFIEVSDALREDALTVKALKSSSYYHRGLSYSSLDIVYIVTTSDTNTNHKAFYRKELVKAIIEHRKLNKVPVHNDMHVVFVDSEATILEYMKRPDVLGDEATLLRKNVDWYNIDDLAPLVPKREVTRVYIDTPKTNDNKPKKSEFERVVVSLLNTDNKYREADAKGKKILMVQATQVSANDSPWKHVLSKITTGTAYGINRKIAALKWVFGVDDIVKVYKSDLKFWQNKGLILAPEGYDEIKDMLKKSLISRDACVIPKVLNSLNFIDGVADLINTKKGSKINFQIGSSDTVLSDGIDLGISEITNIIHMVDSNMVNNIREDIEIKLSKLIVDLSSEEKKALYDAIFSTSIAYSDHYIINDIKNITVNDKDLKSELCSFCSGSIKELKRKYATSSKVKAVVAKLIKNIDIQYK